METLKLTKLKKHARMRKLLILLGAFTIFLTGEATASPPGKNLAGKSAGPRNSTEKMITSPIQCIESMVFDYLGSHQSVKDFAQKWQGAGGIRFQQDGRNFANINPCPEFFSDVLLFVPVRASDGGSLEFNVRNNANLTLNDLVAKFGVHKNVPNALRPGTESFHIRRHDFKFNATIIAEFGTESPKSNDRPYVVTVMREER